MRVSAEHLLMIETHIASLIGKNQFLDIYVTNDIIQPNKPAILVQIKDFKYYQILLPKFGDQRETETPERNSILHSPF